MSGKQLDHIGEKSIIDYWFDHECLKSMNIKKRSLN